LAGLEWLKMRLVSIASIVLSGYVGKGSWIGDEEYLMNSIAASVLGGTTFTGGVGGLGGTAGGAFLLTIIYSILVMLSVEYSGKLIIMGIMLVVARIVYMRLGEKVEEKKVILILNSMGYMSVEELPKNQRMEDRENEAKLEPQGIVNS
jgi:hypothetical protein